MPIRISGMNSGLDTEALVSELVSAYKKKGEKYVKDQTKVSWKQEAWKSLSAKTYSFRNKLDGLRFSSAYKLKKTTVSNSSKASIVASNDAVKGSQTLEVIKLAKSGYLTGGEIKTTNGEQVDGDTRLRDLGLNFTGEIEVNGQKITMNGSTTMNEMLGHFREAGINANFDKENQRFFLSAQDSGEEADFKIHATNAGGAAALHALGLDIEPEGDNLTYQQYYEKYGNMAQDELGAVLEAYGTDKDNDKDTLLLDLAKQYRAAEDEETKQGVVEQFEAFIDYAKDAKYSDGSRIYGQDAEIKLNNATFKSNDNTFNINGLTINALAETDGEVLTVTTTTDAEGIYDKIKSFIQDYNDLINSMTGSYNAEKASDYEPLTDDEKAAMSEDEIKKWEDKGKSAILRRDSSLDTLITAMTSAMSKSYTVNDKQYALSSFGIMTLGILNSEKNEHNAYHIDGDEDDELTSSNEDKLMKAINEDPDGVAEFFKQLTETLYNNLGEHMTSNSLRTYGKFYNDKALDKEYRSYTSTISKWDKKVADIEDSYYKKFAAMESALAKIQSQSSQLSGLLGS